MDNSGTIAFVGLAPDDDEAEVNMKQHLRAYRHLLRNKPDAVACLLAFDVHLKDDPTYNDAISVEKLSARVDRLEPSLTESRS